VRSSRSGGGELVVDETQVHRARGAVGRVVETLPERTHNRVWLGRVPRRGIGIVRDTHADALLDAEQRRHFHH
jgi:hypothetical protein